jgi:hypothetical protein
MANDEVAQTRNIIYKRALQPSSDLPPHPKLVNETTSSVSLSAFAVTALNEGSSFLNTELGPSGRFKIKSKGERKASPSAAGVKVYAFDRPGGMHGREEAWFARVSRHRPAAEPGTAVFAEFDFGLRTDHSKHEMEYTPDVFDAFELVDYGVVGTVEGWEDVEVKVMEMCHHIPFPLLNRVFAVIVVTGRKTGKELVVVQIPVDLSRISAARYSSGAHKKDSSLQARQKKSVVIGEYVSVERCKLEAEEVVWEMATASDAKGSLPMSMQKMAIPGKIVLDVGLFIGWIEGVRKKKGAVSGKKEAAS